MSDGPIRIRVPGKAVLAGEYAVLAGVPAVVAAVGRHLVCESVAASRWSLEGPEGRWEEGGHEAPALAFARAALRLALRYAEGRGLRVPPRALGMRDDLRAPDGTKLGLGGSAATCVAVTAGVLLSAGLEPEPGRVFKLAAVAHAAAQQGPGSAVDLAAATFGGVLWLRRFDARPLLAAASGAPAAFAAVVERFEVPELERLPPPAGFLLVFEGSASSTPALLERVERFAMGAPGEFGEFVARSAAAADKLRRALREADAVAQGAALEASGRLLQGLGERAGVEIVTAAHRRIIEAARACGVAAKISGAGGGDCCVALGESAALAELGRRLDEAGVFWLAPGIDDAGLTVGLGAG